MIPGPFVFANHRIGLYYRLAYLTVAFKIIAIDFECWYLSGIIRRTSNKYIYIYIYIYIYMCVCVLDPFHLQMVNKL